MSLIKFKSLCYELSCSNIKHHVTKHLTGNENTNATFSKSCTKMPHSQPLTLSHSKCLFWTSCWISYRNKAHQQSTWAKHM